MVYVLMTIACILFGGCTLFNKETGSNDEMEKLTQDVLKKGQGIDIEVKPIPNQNVK